MFQTLPHQKIGCMPPLMEIRDLLGRLPPSERAQLAWLPQMVRTAFRRLFKEPVTAALVADVAAEVFPAFCRCLPAVAAFLEDWRTRRAELEGLWRAKLPLLRGLIPDPAAADGAEWAFRAITSMFDALAAVGTEEMRGWLAQSGDRGLEEAVRHPEAGGLLRSQAVLMAILEEAEESQDPGRVVELADWAFMDAAVCVNALARVGLHLDPFRGQTASERATRLLAYAEHARNSLSEQDTAVFEEARMKSLR